jgi:hypothetical protein
MGTPPNRYQAEWFTDWWLWHRPLKLDAIWISKNMRSAVIAGHSLQFCKKRLHCANDVSFVGADNLVVSVPQHNDLRRGVVCF